MKIRFWYFWGVHSEIWKEQTITLHPGPLYGKIKMAEDIYRDGIEEDNGHQDLVDGAFLPDHRIFPEYNDEELYESGLDRGAFEYGCSAVSNEDLINDSGVDFYVSVDANCEQYGGASQERPKYDGTDGRSLGTPQIYDISQSGSLSQHSSQSHSITHRTSQSLTHGVEHCAQTFRDMRLNSAESTTTTSTNRDSAYYSNFNPSLLEQNNNSGSFSFQNTDLISQNRDCNLSYYVDEDGDSQLHLAVTQRREDVVSELLDCNLPPGYVNLRDAHGRTALHLAVLTNQPELFRLLLDKNADPSVRDRSGDTPLHTACCAGLLSCVRMLVMLISTLCPSGTYDPNCRNYQGHTCLHLAAAQGHRDITTFLIKHFHVDVNAGDGCSGRTILHHAADRGDKLFVYFLLNEFGHKLNINALAHDRRTTPLVLAKGREHYDIVQVLEAGGALNRIDSDYTFDTDTDSESEMDY